MDKLSKYLLEIKSKKKSIFLSILLFFILGFFFVINETPKYSISIAVNQNNEESQGINPGNIVSLALGQGGSNASKFYYDLTEAFFSMEVTKSFDSQHDGVRKFFGGFYNEASQEYEQIWNLSTRLQFIKFYLLGIDFNPIPNVYLLNNFIKGTISITYDEFADLIYITSLTDSPNQIEQLIIDLLKETDNYFKTKEKDQIDERINFLTSELNSISSISQRDAISRILQNQLLKKSLVGTNELYKIKIIRDVEISEYPVQPNVLFILILFSMFGFFLAVGFHTLIFVKDEFGWKPYSD
tara:strand:- start:123 stop:1016 length:894 start_codon:yes stop_codon:yes gene_type:complete